MEMEMCVFLNDIMFVNLIIESKCDVIHLY